LLAGSCATYSTHQSYLEGATKRLLFNN
jgi:hypothetical protein